MDTRLEPNLLQAKLERRRRGDPDPASKGVTDPARQVGIELQNITDVLLEILKELRFRKP